MRQAAVFVALDHCSAECVGIHAAARATRFETLEPIRQGVRQHFGGFTKAIARGLAVRHDHGLQYMSDHFQKELAFLGVDEINKIEIQYDVIDEAHHAGKLTKQKWKHLPWKMTESEMKSSLANELHKVFTEGKVPSNPTEKQEFYDKRRAGYMEAMFQKLDQLRGELGIREGLDYIVLFSQEWTTSPYMPGVDFAEIKNADRDS